jgi:hypothetical protein
MIDQQQFNLVAFVMMEKGAGLALFLANAFRSVLSHVVARGA